MSTPRDIHGKLWHERVPVKVKSGPKPTGPTRVENNHPKGDSSLPFQPIPNAGSRRKARVSNRASHHYPGFAKRERNRRRRSAA